VDRSSTADGALEGAVCRREYGLANVTLSGDPGPLFQDWATGDQVWMSHGDHVEAVPPGFLVTATSNGVIAGMMSPDRRTFGLQFHPEVTHSVRGRELVARFVRDVCGAVGDWTPGSFVEEQIARIRAQVGDAHRDLRPLRRRGLVRGGRAPAQGHRRQAGVHLRGQRVACCGSGGGGAVREGSRSSTSWSSDASERFLGALDGVTDPEKKRKIIGETFIACSRKRRPGASPTRSSWRRARCTPTSSRASRSRAPERTIKSHHNVGGLPADMKFKLVEPLRELFKDEVRAGRASLGLPRGDACGATRSRAPASPCAASAS
jgi:GMP synthase (glutamine-hydrolysing)